MTCDIISPEQRLFVGVIANAAQEAAGKLVVPDRGKHPTATRDDARAWFVESGEDFATVCELAGYEPHDVRTRVLAYLDRVERDPDARANARRTSTPIRHRGVSIGEVARQADVSPTTVSNVIHGRAQVAPETRTRVRAAMDSLGYRPNVH